MAKRRKTRRRPGKNPGKLFFWTAVIWALLTCIVVLIYLLPLPRLFPPGVRPPFEEPKAPGPPKQSVPAHKAPCQVPRVAIIIDDMGYDLSLDRAFIQLEAPLSFAFLPQAPFTRKLAREAGRNGRDVLVHLPLEPENKSLDPGPGVLTVDMGFDVMLSQLKQDLDAVPGAIGVNNHMGSRFTADKKAMEIILTEIKRRGLFFVDSRTTKYTVAYKTALSLGVPSTERSVFLDDDTRPESIKSELERLRKLALSRGMAVAIGHPHVNTLRVLYQNLPQLARDVKIVSIHELVKKENP